MARVNQHLIAKQLNLSQTTVSRALANHPATNAETKAIVWRLAAQLGYEIPPPRGRSTGSRAEPITTGVVIAGAADASYGAETSQDVLRGVAERSSSDVVTLDVLYQEPSRFDPKLIQRRLRQNRWKGAILVQPMTDEVVDVISKTVPTVSIIENYQRNCIDSVDVDQIEAIGGLVRKLASAGHERIGFLSLAYNVPTPWVYHRFGAYVETLYELGLESSSERALNVRRGQRLDIEALVDQAVIAIEKGTTAFVCAADHQAYQIERCLRKRGISVPEDCSLTGFDGIEPPAGQLQVATVRVPYDEIGRSAFHQLMRRIEQPQAPRRHVLVDGLIIEGESIAIPAGGAPPRL